MVEFIGKLLNTLEHMAGMSRLGGFLYWVICKLPDRFYSENCWLCEGKMILLRKILRAGFVPLSGDKRR